MSQSTNVIVYSSSNCHYCKQVKGFLEARGVNYEERNIDTDDKYAEELWNTGMRSVPVTVIGETNILGFNQTQLTKALADIQN